MTDFPSRILTLSFDISASCEADLPDASGFRKALTHHLPMDVFFDAGQGWRIETIDIAPQPQPVNAELLSVARRAVVAADHDHPDYYDGMEHDVAEEARAAIAAATPTTEA